MLSDDLTRSPAIDAVDRSAMKHLEKARMVRPDLALIVDEFHNAATMLRIVCLNLNSISESKDNVATELRRILGDTQTVARQQPSRQPS